MSDRELLGHVDVDSGRLVVMDPGYVPTWTYEGPTVGIKFWGAGQEKTAIYMRSKGRTLQRTESDSYIVVESDQQEQEKIKLELSKCVPKYGMLVWGDYQVSDDECSFEVTCSEKQGGSVPYPMGHEGLAVAFASGLGDGTYAVYANYVDVPSWGRRIKSVEIELISDDEMMEG